MENNKERPKDIMQPICDKEVYFAYLLQNTLDLHAIKLTYFGDIAEFATLMPTV